MPLEPDTTADDLAVSSILPRVQAEGWYEDPYNLHTDRWFSDGEPTDLVRDDGVESRDSPPAATFSGQLVEAAEEQPENGDDLRRADDPAAGQTYNTRQAVDAAIDAAAQSGGGFS